MNFENYKKQFDSSFAKVSPKTFINEMEALGYSFNDTVQILEKTKVINKS